MATRTYLITNVSSKEVKIPDIVGDALRTGLYSRNNSKQDTTLKPSGQSGDSITVYENNTVINSMVRGGISKLVADSLITVSEIDPSQTKTTVTASTANYEVDFATAHHYDITLSANCTFTFDGTVPTFTKATFIIRQMSSGGTYNRTLAWPASVLWAAQTAPTITTGQSNADYIELTTHNGGTTWVGTAVQDLIA
jgi:hypothetical protein